MVVVSAISLEWLMAFEAVGTMGNYVVVDLASSKENEMVDWMGIQ